MRTACASAVAALTLGAATAGAAVTPAPGYIYSAQLLSSLTQGCIAAGPGGTFVGVGPAFTANAQSIVLARESGDLRLVAAGFSSIADCAYDAANDVLYVTDNADNADLGITTAFGNTGAQSGDTVFRIPAASTASGLSAAGLELLPADAIEFAAGVTVDGTGNVLVANSAGGGAGAVLQIAPGPVTTTLVGGLQFAGGLAIAPSSNLFVGQNLGLPTFDNELRQFTALGAPVPPLPFAGPSFAFGSVDLAIDADGRLLVSGNFGADVVSFNPADGSSIPFASGLTFASGMTVDSFTGRVQILSSTFSAADEDKSLHRFTRTDRLVAGGGSPASDCLHEFYGIELVGKEAACTDGAACDGDGEANGICHFPIGFCVNVDDPDLPECGGDTISELRIEGKPFSPALAAAASATPPFAAATCLFSDGYALPLKTTGSGVKANKATVKVQAVSLDGRKDTDVVKLVCLP